MTGGGIRCWLGLAASPRSRLGPARRRARQHDGYPLALGLLNCPQQWRVVQAVGLDDEHSGIMGQGLANQLGLR